MKKIILCSVGILFLLFLTSCNATEQAISVSSREPNIGIATQEGTSIANDATPDVFQQVEETPIQVDPTVTATLVMEPIPTVQAVATPTAQTESPTPLLPSITFGVASTQAYSVTCLETDMLGQIWMSSPPYKQAELLLAHDEVSYGEPYWSLDGTQLAVIKILVKDSKITTQNNGEWTQYQEQISIINIEDGSVNDIDKKFTRLEFFSNENSGCGVASRISSIIGWSQNNEWLAYTVFEKDGTEGLTSGRNLYVVNIETGQNVFIAANVLDVTWVKPEATLAFNNSGDSLEIRFVEVDFEPVEKLVIDAPFSADSKKSLYQIAFPTDKVLYATITDNTSFNAPSTLWSYSLTNSEWLQLEMEQINGKPGFVIGAENESLIICFEKDGVLKLRSMDIVTETPIYDFEMPDVSITCDLAISNNLIGAYNRFHIWMVNIYDLEQAPQQIIDIDDTNIPQGYEITSITWMP